MSADLFVRRLTPTPVSGDGPEFYDKRGFGPPWREKSSKVAIRTSCESETEID